MLGLRWGEQFVFLFLKSKYYNGYKCRWVNQHEESGKPYDLILTRRGQGGNEGEHGVEEIYVEVKSTTGGKEDAGSPFPISLPELLFANDKKERFHLYRVFRAGTNAATVLAVSDFYRRLTWASQLYCQVSVSAAAGTSA